MAWSRSFCWTLAQEQAKAWGEGQTEEDKKLSFPLMAYRSAENEATAYTPTRLMLGREICRRMDLIKRRPPDEEVSTVSMPWRCRSG